MQRVTDIFVIKLDQIQPCQLYISSEKLSNVLREYDRFKPDLLEPLPVKNLDDKVILTNDHTVALAAYLRGISEIRVFWDDGELDLEAYQTCANWCKKEGVHSIADLKNRVVTERDYELLWTERCEDMMQELEAKRAKTSLLVIVPDPEDEELIESK